MRVTITTQTMETVLGMVYKKNKQAFSRSIERYGIGYETKTIERHLEAGDVGPIIDIPALARICADRHYAFPPCFTVIGDDGKVLSDSMTVSCRTNEPLVIEVWNLARTLTEICPDLSIIDKEVHINIDRRLLYLIGNNNIACMSGISSSRLICFFLKYGIDLNEFFVQKGFRFPVVSMAPDIRVPDNSTIKIVYDLMMEFLDLAKRFNRLKRMFNMRRVKLSKRRGGKRK